MLSVNFSIFKSRKPSRQIKLQDYIIWRKECGGRVYFVGGMVTGGVMYKGSFTWEVTPLVEWDDIAHQWQPHRFNLRSMNVAEDTVVSLFQDIAEYSLQAVS